MKTFLTPLFFLLMAQPSVGQDFLLIDGTHPLYTLEERLMEGDESALFKIAAYFDHKEDAIEYLGYHEIITTESAIAKRMVVENCLFTNEEIVLTDSTSAETFRNFLLKHRDKIAFSTLASAFLITPLDKRPVQVEIRALSETRKQMLQENAPALLGAKWAKEARIESLLKQHNPACLLFVASELFKIRSRFNSYHFNEAEFTNLLQFLTGTEIGVENEKHEISWHIDADYQPDSKRNLLIYFSKFYREYVWDENKSVFVLPGQVVKPIGKEEALFQTLNSSDEAVAREAFLELTVSNPTQVGLLADEYQYADVDYHHALPTFPYRFLKQLALLTEYCRANAINYTGTPALQRDISLLQTKLTFPERRKLEDKLINTLSLNDITALEYQALVQEDSWELTYSAGRILDVFYGKKFAELLADEAQLIWYLKKSALFDNLGMIGVRYLQKFRNLQSPGLERLNALTSTDSDVKTQAAKAAVLCKTVLKKPHNDRKTNDTNRDYKIRNLGKKIRSASKIKDAEKMEEAITELLSKISYRQIGEALPMIEPIPFNKHPWYKYTFLERDFGFFAYSNFDSLSTRTAFLRDYHQYDELGFYKNMLDKSGIQYTSTDGALDYDAIFDILKYNVVTAFVGGGGGVNDNEVYAIIKVLELTQHTTLGYPKKLCNSNGVNGCNTQGRTRFWMQYLRDKKLLKQAHDEPVSFD